jgi:hypothetical protein
MKMDTNTPNSKPRRAAGSPETPALSRASVRAAKRASPGASRGARQAAHVRTSAATRTARAPATAGPGDGELGTHEIRDTPAPRTSAATRTARAPAIARPGDAQVGSQDVRDTPAPRAPAITRAARAPAIARPDVFAAFRCDWFRILAELQQMGMCCSDVARYLRVADSTVRNWKYGTEPVHSRGEALRALLARAHKEHKRLISRAGRKTGGRARHAGTMQAWLRAQEAAGQAAGDASGKEGVAATP